MRCLVTGASGYLGGELVRLLLGQGLAVRAVVCRGDLDAPVELLVRCDLVEGLPARSLEGVDTIYHLAGLAHEHARAEDYRRINVEATRRLARDAVAAGVRRFIFLSSVKAMSADRPVNGYAQSKADAERLLPDIAGAGDMELVIVRPALIYGGSARGYLGFLERWVRWRMPAPPPGGRRSMVARDDLLQLLLILSRVSVQEPLTLTVTDGETYSVRRLHDAMVAAAGGGPTLPSPPRWLWRLGCRCADTLLRVPPGSSWQRLQGEEYYPCSDLEQICGFTPALVFEDRVCERGLV